MKMITNNNKLMAANVTAQRGQKFVSSTHFGFKLHFLTSNLLLRSDKICFINFV